MYFFHVETISELEVVTKIFKKATSRADAEQNFFEEAFVASMALQREIFMPRGNTKEFLFLV